MATKIGFKVRDKAIIPDVSPLFDLSKTLLEQEDTREKQRQTWRDEQDALRKSQTELTPTENQDANQFFGKFSQGIIDESLDLQKMLQSGQINSSDYSAQWRNLNQSNEQMIAAQTSYQKTAQKITEDVANGITSEVNTKNLNHFNKVFQPGAMEVERDGRGGLRLFNKKTGDIVSPSYLSNLTNSNLPKYDYMKVADTLVKQFGVRGFTDAAGNTIKGVYANMDKSKLDELMLIESKALLDGAQAPIVSILVDGMGYDVVYNEDELKDGSVYRKPDGTFAFSEDDKEKAELFMSNALKNALPLLKEEAADLTAVQKEQIRLQEKRLDQGNKEEKNKIKKDETALKNLSKLFYGNEQDAKVASNFIRGLTGNKDLRIVLQGDSMIIQRIKEDGTIETTGTISKQGGLKNFIESSVTLLGIDVNNVQDALSRSGILKDSEGNEFQPNPISLISETTVTKTPSTVDEITTMINSDIDAIEINNAQATNEEDLAQILSAALGKYNVQVSQEDSGSDVIGLKLPTGDLLTVDLKQATPKSIKETIKTLILGDINQDTLIKYKGKLQGGSTQTSSTGGTAR